MDQAFLRRAQAMLDRSEPAPLDHQMLLAALAAQRAADGGEGDEARPESASPVDEEPLVELLVAGPGWQQAVTAQRGCFSRAEVRRRVNDR